METSSFGGTAGLRAPSTTKSEIDTKNVPKIGAYDCGFCNWPYKKVFRGCGVLGARVRVRKAPLKPGN